MDWAGFKAHGCGYLSALPVQMDGTCNGLQNFSAILRDEIGGRAVNLIPSDKPQDIYTEVMNLVIHRVNADTSNEELFGTAPKGGEDHRTTVGALARGWVGNINRKVVKRPVMTLAYPSVPMMMRQRPAGSLPLRAEVSASDGYAPYQ